MGKPTVAPDPIASVIGRLDHDAQAAGVTVIRLADDAVALRLGEEAAILTFDESNGTYRVHGPEILTKEEFGAGDRVSGFNYHGVFDISQAQQMTLLAGKAVQLSGSMVLEPSTGRLEPQPASDLGRYLYDRLVPFGWHHQGSTQGLTTILIVGAIFAVVFIALAVAIGASIFL